ncbi:hypothetical protein V6N11_037659 [Hibiscus sabdariffa]|uniref:Retrovirus-related Pol polyprotein from transposon TNT 1-94-like beta-barrel domain-containing protein n=1 Tax=Hibiscus sabdariffa TaxID=183260 RepID=A0ABR2PBY1_9ROSI
MEDKAPPEPFNCYVCEQVEHKDYQCQQWSNCQNENRAQLNVAKNDDNVKATVVSEVNIVTNNTEWIVDTNAFRHLCIKQKLFIEFEDMKSGEQVYMRNFNSSEVLNKGKVLLKLGSDKTLALSNIFMYLPCVEI